MIVLDKIINRDSDKPIADSDNILGAYKVFLNITKLKEFPIDKRITNQLATIQYYNELNENTTDSGVNQLMKFKGTSTANIDWEDLSLWTIIDDTSLSGANITDITFDNLVLAIDNNTLNPECEYNIVDFKTIYTQPITNLISTNEVSLDTTFEPLIVKASSSNTLYLEAKSQLYPSDYILYDVTYTDNGAKGKIIKRVIADNISADYDIRNVKFRRYSILADNWNYETTYTYSDIVILNNSYYVCKSLDSLNESPDINLENWFHIEMLDTYKYIISSDSQFNWFHTNLLDYEDIYTICNYNSVTSDYTLDAINGKYTITVNGLDSNNVVLIGDNSAENININGSHNTILVDVNIEDFQLKNSSYNVILNAAFESNLIDVHNSFITGLIRSDVRGNFEKCKMFGDGEAALFNCTIIARHDDTLNYRFDSYNRQVNVQLTSIANVTLHGSHVRLSAENWENVNIPKEIAFINCTFNIPQYKGLLVYNTLLPLVYYGVNFIKYYADDLQSPTVEKIFFDVVGINGSSEIKELGRNYEIDVHGVFPMTFPILLI